MEKVFEIIKIVGLGVVESPNKEFSTGLIYHNKETADQKANELWLENTTEEDRNSGWCGLHFIVKERNVM